MIYVNDMQDIFGSNFIVKMFLIPGILGMIYIFKYLIRHYKLNKNSFFTYILYSTNFTFLIIVLKLLFTQIDKNSPEGGLLSDTSLIFVVMAIDYFVVSYYKYVEYAVIPLFLLFYALYTYTYGFDIRSTVLVLLALFLFWTSLYIISKYRLLVTKKRYFYLFASFPITLSVMLISSSRFQFSLGYSVGIFLKICIMLFIAEKVLAILKLIVQEYSELRKYSYMDTLTNTYNRRKFEETLQEIIESQYMSVFTVVLFDVDAFKHINDTYGHAAGDHTLKEICELVRIKLKKENTSGQLFRYGGDEFFIIFRNNLEEEVKEIMEDIVDMVSTYDFEYEKSSFKASISVGAVEVVGAQEQQEIINDVDKKLYIAKSKGKNQVVY